MHEITLERYYNRFYDQPQFFDYKSLLFRAGDSLQSAELNEVQQTLKNDIGFVAQKFARNGEFLYGGEVSTTYTLNGNVDNEGNDLFDVTIECKEGIFFVEGEFVMVENKTITKTDVLIAEANWNVGPIVSFKVILEGEDPSLLDPAINTRNFGRPGAGRLQVTGEWVTEDSAQETENDIFYPTTIIEHGEVVVDGMTDDELTQKIVDIVAKYDRNSNGNYLLNGYEVTFTDKESYLGNFNFQIAEGSANVYGYNYERTETSPFTLPQLVDFELKQSEPINFSNGDGYYEVRHTPIRKVFRISGQKTTTQNITHGSYTGCTDPLPSEYTPVISIQSVTQGSTTFVEGTDFVLDGDSINWGPSGNEPAPNTTYTVAWTYQYTETDPNFTGNNGELNEDRSRIFLEDFKPNTTVSIDYDFVLERVDVIYIGSKGLFFSAQGVAKETFPLAPHIDDEHNLKLAEVLLSGGDDPQVTMNAQRVFKMSDIQKILDDVRNNQYNIARISLDIDSKNKLSGLKLKNSFVDTFDNDDYRDPGYEDVEGFSKAETIDGELKLPLDWEITPIHVSDSLPSKMVTLIPDTSSLYLSQPYHTKVRKINAFMFRAAPQAQIKVTPSLFRWVDRNIYRSYVVNNFSTDRWCVRAWWFHRGASRAWFRCDQRRTWRTYLDQTRLVRQTSSSSAAVYRETRAKIIPQINLRVTSRPQDFNSNENVDIYFDGIHVSTATTDSNGTLNEVFTIPAGVWSGTKKVWVKAATSGVQGTAWFRAEPLYRIITTRITRWWRRTHVRVWDPISQTFTPERDFMLDKIKVWFEDAPVSRTMLSVVETTAGMPDIDKVIVFKEAEVGSINSNSPYEFVFDDKVLLKAEKEYAFIVACEDAVGSVQVARLGERDDEHGLWLTSQSYSVGVLLISSNQSTWTPVQEEDMRFEIYETDFNTTRTVYFKTMEDQEINVSGATDLMVVNVSEVAEGCEVSYYFKFNVDGTEQVYRVNPNEQFKFPFGAYSGVVTVYAELKSNGKVTPYLERDGQIFIGTTASTGSYVSRGIPFDPSDSKIVLYLDEYLEGSSQVVPTVQIKQGGTVMWKPMTFVEGEDLGEGWVENKYEFDIQAANPDYDQSLTRVKLDLSTTNIVDRPYVANLRLNSISI